MKGTIIEEPGIIYAPYVPVMFAYPGHDDFKGKFVDEKCIVEYFYKSVLVDTIIYFLKDNKWFRIFGEDFENDFSLEVKDEIILKELNMILRKEKLEKLLK